MFGLKLIDSLLIEVLRIPSNSFNGSPVLPVQMLCSRSITDLVWVLDGLEAGYSTHSTWFVQSPSIVVVEIDGSFRKFPTLVGAHSWQHVFRDTVSSLLILWDALIYHAVLSLKRISPIRVRSIIQYLEVTENFTSQVNRLSFSIWSHWLKFIHRLEDSCRGRQMAKQLETRWQ